MTNRKHFPDHNVALTIRSPLEVSRANQGDFFPIKMVESMWSRTNKWFLFTVKYSILQLNRTSASVFLETDYDKKKWPHIFISLVFEASHSN